MRFIVEPSDAERDERARDPTYEDLLPRHLSIPL